MPLIQAVETLPGRPRRVSVFTDRFVCEDTAWA